MFTSKEILTIDEFRNLMSKVQVFLTVEEDKQRLSFDLSQINDAGRMAIFLAAHSGVDKGFLELGADGSIAQPVVKNKRVVQQDIWWYPNLPQEGLLPGGPWREISAINRKFMIPKTKIGWVLAYMKAKQAIPQGFFVNGRSSRLEDVVK